MRKRVWLSGAMGAIGAAMLIAAALAGTASSKPSAASSSGQKKGGTMNVNMSATDVDYSDPALAYGTNSWQILDAVCAKLTNYPDRPGAAGTKLVADAAVGFPTVSKDGKTYTFTIRSGWRSNTGEALTAANFAYAFNRDLNPKMQSPAVPFITGANGIVGAQAVADGKAATASGIVAKGQKLTIKLQKPDGSFLSKLAMDFFCAIPKSTPINADGITTFASFGPYYIASRQVGRQIIVKENPNYRGPRPHNVNTFAFTANTNLDQSLLQVKAGQSDYDAGGLPPTAHAGLAQQFGINKGRYFVSGGLNIDYAALNTSRPTFSKVGLRKAVQYAIDRPAMVRQRGYLAGRRDDQILPPGIAGYKNYTLYPIKGSDYTKAKSLATAAGGCKDVTLYTGNTAVGQGLGQILRYNLTQIGCSVNVKLFQGFQIYIAAGTRGEPYDVVLGGWFADYADPYDFIDILLNGENIHESNNNNLAYLNAPALNKQMKSANALVGDARYNAYQNLDLNIQKNYAPLVTYENRNIREFVSSRTGGYVFSNAHGLANLNTFFLK
jgi:peptide/nickel transport system substrate-binding protein